MERDDERYCGTVAKSCDYVKEKGPGKTGAFFFAALQVPNFYVTPSGYRSIFTSSWIDAAMTMNRKASTTAQAIIRSSQCQNGRLTGSASTRRPA